MANVAFPRVQGSQMGIKFNTPGLGVLRSPYGLRAPQVVSRGVGFWTGTLTWPIKSAALQDEHAADELMAFFARLEGGLHTFDIPLAPLQSHKSERFPTKDESDNDNSVQVTARSPDSTNASLVGYASEITLDTPASQGVGLRQGDYFSLHNADLTTHHGLFQCGTNQVGSTVTVAPRAPDFAAGVTAYRMNARTPTIRVRLTGDMPVLVRTGAWLEPITISWIQEF